MLTAHVGDLCRSRVGGLQLSCSAFKALRVYEVGVHVSSFAGGLRPEPSVALPWRDQTSPNARTNLRLQCRDCEPQAKQSRAGAVRLPWIASFPGTSPGASQRPGISILGSLRRYYAPCIELSENGSERSRLPVAAKMAFEIAGATAGTPGSPTPVGGSDEGTMCTSTFGMSLMRSGS